jgi:hypothetical protein
VFEIVGIRSNGIKEREVAATAFYHSVVVFISRVGKAKNLNLLLD